MYPNFAIAIIACDLYGIGISSALESGNKRWKVISRIGREMNGSGYFQKE